MLLVTGLLSRRPAGGRGSETSSAGGAPLELAPPADALAALICRTEGDDRSRDDDDDVRALLMPEAERRSCAGIAEGAKDCPLLPVGDNGRTAADTPGTPAALEGNPVILGGTCVLRLC